MAGQKLSFQHKNLPKIFFKINFLWQKKKRDIEKHPVYRIMFVIYQKFLLFLQWDKKLEGKA